MIYELLQLSQYWTMAPFSYRGLIWPWGVHGYPKPVWVTYHMLTPSHLVVVSIKLMDFSSLTTSSEKSSRLMDLYFLKACFLVSGTLLLDVISNKTKWWLERRCPWCTFLIRFESCWLMTRSSVFCSLWVGNSTWFVRLKDSSISLSMMAFPSSCLLMCTLRSPTMICSPVVLIFFPCMQLIHQQIAKHWSLVAYR